MTLLHLRVTSDEGLSALIRVVNAVLLHGVSPSQVHARFQGTECDIRITVNPSRAAQLSLCLKRVASMHCVERAELTRSDPADDQPDEHDQVRSAQLTTG